MHQSMWYRYDDLHVAQTKDLGDCVAQMFAKIK